jgi:tripartite-type tricarboxylate transporter receptor subunit TctC
MKFRIAFAALALLASSAAAQAQLQPLTKIVVPYAPGGSTDLLSRLLADHIQRANPGKQFIIENRPGAGAVIGTEAVFRAPPDGATIGVVANSFLINSKIKQLAYDPLTSFEPLCHLVDSPQVIVVNAKSPWKTLAEFLAEVRANPGKHSIGSLGPATTQHVAVAMFLKTARIELNYVPFTGGAPATNAILGGHVTSIIGNYSEVEPQIAAGELRVLATTNATRIKPLPDVPTVRELGLDFEVTAWFALVATGKTPAPVVASLIDAFSGAMKSPEILSRLDKLQLFPVNKCGADFAAYLKAQDAAMGPIVKEAGIKE